MEESGTKEAGPGLGVLRSDFVVEFAVEQTADGTFLSSADTRPRRVRLRNALAEISPRIHAAGWYDLLTSSAMLLASICAD